MTYWAYSIWHVRHLVSKKKKKSIHPSPGALAGESSVSESFLPTVYLLSRWNIQTISQSAAHGTEAGPWGPLPARHYPLELLDH